MNSKEKKKPTLSVDIRGYDKKIYLLSFFIVGFSLTIPAFVIENTSVLSIFTILVAFSLGREINTVVEDIEPTKKNFWIILLLFIISILIALVLGLYFGWDKLWDAIKWSVQSVPPYPAKYMSFFLAISSTMLIRPIIISSFANHIRITPNEFEIIRGFVELETTVIGDATIRSRVIITDLRELLSFLFAGTIIIEKLEGKEWVELLKVENVIFAHYKSWRINKVFNAKTVILTTAA